MKGVIVGLVFLQFLPSLSRMERSIRHRQGLVVEKGRLIGKGRISKEWSVLWVSYCDGPGLALYLQKTKDCPRVWEVGGYYPIGEVDVGTVIFFASNQEQ